MLRDNTAAPSQGWIERSTDMLGRIVMASTVLCGVQHRMFCFSSTSGCDWSFDVCCSCECGMHLCVAFWCAQCENRPRNNRFVLNICIPRFSVQGIMPSFSFSTRAFAGLFCCGFCSQRAEGGFCLGLGFIMDHAGRRSIQLASDQSHQMNSDWSSN